VALSPPGLTPSISCCFPFDYAPLLCWFGAREWLGLELLDEVFELVDVAEASLSGGVRSEDF